EHLQPVLLFFNHTATPEFYTLSLHDALPIYPAPPRAGQTGPGASCVACFRDHRRTGLADRRTVPPPARSLAPSDPTTCTTPRDTTLRALGAGPRGGGVRPPQRPRRPAGEPAQPAPGGRGARPARRAP